jgi:RND family efflux transporter, MFP subunit
MSFAKTTGSMPNSQPWYRKKFLLSILVGTIALIFIIIGLYFTSEHYLYIDNAMVDGEKISISSKYPGKIAKMFASEGSFVSKGQLLVTIDDDELLAQKRQGESSLLYNEENVKSCALNLDKATDDFNRTQNIYKMGELSTVEYEQAKIALDSKRIQKKMADAQVDSAKAQLNIIENQIKASTIYAPDDGVIAKKYSYEGDVIQSSQVIYTIYNLHNVYVVANVDETEFRNVHLGQKAFITIDAYPGRKFRGSVVSVTPCTVAQFTSSPINNNSSDFTKVSQVISLRIMLHDISNNDIKGHSPILPGMYVEVKLKEK